MIDLNRTQQLHDIIHGSIQYSGLEGSVISNPIFNRLHRILQSSLVYLTYSSNKVKRFEHSLGTMHLAGKIISNSFGNIQNGKKENNIIDKFFDEVKNEISNWCNECDFTQEKMLNQEMCDRLNIEEILTSPIPDASLYRQNTPRSISENNIFAYTVIYQAIRLAGLLHDIGHLPYSHILEHAVETLKIRVDEIDVNKRNDAQKDFLKITNQFDTDALHEGIGIRMLKQIKLSLSEELKMEDTNIFVILVFYFTLKILESKPVDNNLFSDLHRVVSGILDADRLDYCSRDIFCAGVNKDVFPYDRLLLNYRLISRKWIIDNTCDDKRERFWFSPSTKNITEVENLLDRRWKIFNDINFHHRVHKHEILFAEVLAEIGYEELKTLQTLPKIMSGEALPLCVSAIWSLISKVQESRTYIDYIIIQLDDSWLDTLLKTTFFKKYKNKFRYSSNISDLPLWSKFDELISASKRYFSGFKRSADFLAFDEQFCRHWVSKETVDMSTCTNEVVKMVHEKIIKCHKQYISDETKTVDKRVSFFAFNNTIKTLVLDKKETFSVFQTIEKMLNDFLQKDGVNLEIIECLVRPISIKTGCADIYNPVFFWHNNKGLSYERAELSHQHNQLKKYQMYTLPFHICYLPKSEAVFTNIEGLIDKLAEISVIVLQNKIESLK